MLCRPHVCCGDPAGNVPLVNTQPASPSLDLRPSLCTASQGCVPHHTDASSAQGADPQHRAARQPHQPAPPALLSQEPGGCRGSGRVLCLILAWLHALPAQLAMASHAGVSGTYGPWAVAPSMRTWHAGSRELPLTAHLSPSLAHRLSCPAAFNRMESPTPRLAGNRRLVSQLALPGTGKQRGRGAAASALHPAAAGRQLRSSQPPRKRTSTSLRLKQSFSVGPFSFFHPHPARDGMPPR